MENLNFHASLMYLKERLCVGPVLAGGVVKEAGETELCVVGDDLLSEPLTTLGESMEDEGVSFFPMRERGGPRGGVKRVKGEWQNLRYHLIQDEGIHYVYYSSKMPIYRLCLSL